MTLLLAISLVAGIKSGNASRYGFEGDIYDDVGKFACRRTLESRFGGRGFEKMRKHGVAHRTLPCGTRLGVCHPRTGLCTLAYVVDRGPWGAINKKGEWHSRTSRLLPGEHYRGDLDLLPGTYSAIGLVGIESVLYWQLADGSQNAEVIRTGPRVGWRLPILRTADAVTPTLPTLLADAVLPTVYPPLRLMTPGTTVANLASALPPTGIPVTAAAAAKYPVLRLADSGISDGRIATSTRR